MVIWIDRLTLIAALNLIINPALYRCTEVRYFSATNTGLMLLMLNRRLLRLRCELGKAHWDLGVMKDGQGRSLRYSIEELTASIIEAIISQVFNCSAYLAASSLRELPAPWVRKYFGNCLYDRTRLCVQSVIVVDYHQRQVVERNNTIQRHLLFLSDIGFLRRILANLGQYEHVEVRQYGGSLGWCVQILATLPEMIRFARSNFASLWGALRPRTIYVGGGPPCEHGVIAVESCWGIESLNKRNDIFWWTADYIPPERVLIYFDRPDHKLTSDTESFIASRGFRSVLRSKLAADNNSQNVWLPSANLSLDLLKALPELLWRALASGSSLSLSVRIWMFAYMLRMIQDVFYWKCFFHCHNALVNICHTGDVGNLHVAQSLGMHLAGGINVSSTYSFYSFSLYRHARDYHVYFPWGPSSHCSNLSLTNNSMYCVSVGYLFDYTFDVVRRGNRDVRSGLHKNGATFILAIFDSNFNETSHHSYVHMREFYAGMVQFLLTERDLGFVFKPKKLGSPLDRFVSLFPEIEPALATGRCRILPRAMPCEAAAEADAAVAFGMAAAGIEAALFGIPVVYWSPTGVFCEQLHNNDNARLVFDELPDLLESIRVLKDGSPNPHNVGNHAHIFSGIDPWMDGMARNRMCEFLYHYMDAYDAGFPRKVALDKATANYAARWGTESVIAQRV